MKSVFFYSDALANFDYGRDHPLKPYRARKALELCRRYRLIDHPWIKLKEPSAATEEEIALFHSREYIDILKKADSGIFSIEMFDYGLGTEDNPVVEGLYDWSSLAAGATLDGARLIRNGDADVVFNPIGGFHHAGRSYAGGFCYINDVGIALTFLENEGLKTAFLDIDAHHCNGIQEGFYDDPRVLVVSLHEFGEDFYPQTGRSEEIGEGAGRGYNVNIPLAPYTDDEVYLFAFEKGAFPIISAFEPELLVVEIGADTLVSDPLTHLKLTNNAYIEVISRCKKVCNKILAVGGGGYDIFRTARAWTLAWATLNDVVPKDEYAGIIGGMMYGPEAELGSLYDRPYIVEGDKKDKAFSTARESVKSVLEKIFPILGLKADSAL